MYETRTLDQGKARCSVLPEGLFHCTVTRWELQSGCNACGAIPGQNWSSAGGCHSCTSQLLLSADKIILRFLKSFVSIIMFCSNHCSPLAHDYITVSPRNWQLSTTRIAKHLFSPLHVEKSIRGSPCAVNVNCAKITKSETSVTMETLKARLISRINYDKKLFMAVFKQ